MSAACPTQRADQPIGRRNLSTNDLTLPVSLPEKDIERLRVAAEEGNAGAAMQICDYFIDDLGDESEGVKWYKRARAAGHPPCANALGIEAPYYTDNIWRKAEVPPKEKLPQERRLGKAGDPAAQYRLGALFANGAGVSLDFVQAYAWFVVSARPGLNQSLTSTSKHGAIPDWGTPSRAVRVLEQVMEEGELELAKILATDYLNRFGGRPSVTVKLSYLAESCKALLIAIAVILPLLVFRSIWKQFFSPNKQQ